MNILTFLVKNHKMNILTFLANNYKMNILTFWTNNFNMNILGTQPASTSPKCIQDHPLCILLLQCTQVTHSQPLHPNSVSRITHCVISYFSALRSHTVSLSGSLLQLKDNIFYLLGQKCLNVIF